MIVERVSVDDIQNLRVRVLRQGTPVTHAHYPEDSYADAVHLAIRERGELCATSTWFSNECPEFPHVPALQLTGYGRALIDAGLSLARERGAVVVWARARDSALGFYEKCGFMAMGDGFIDEPTNMPHHIVVTRL
jgi:GNAT superfamily N-acetyltransferase